MDQFGQAFLGTVQGILPGPSSITGRIRGEPKGSRIIGKKIFSSFATIDAIVSWQPQQLQSFLRGLFGVRLRTVRITRSRFSRDPTNV